MKLFIKLYTMLDHTPNEVDNFKRGLAYMIDWFVGYLIFSIPIATIWLSQTKDSSSIASDLATIANRLGNGFAYLALALAVVFAIVYYVVYPLKKQGQSFGKNFMDIKIVKVNGDPVDMKTMIIRQIIGIFLIEGFIYGISDLMRQVFSISGFPLVAIVLTGIAVIISAISLFLGLRFQSHRMLHDYLANTKVVPAKKDKMVKK